ncbi:hypothetical protein [Isoptericola variabilis]|uniref:Uncharacterized protein n=1 Tax=Isoptericola variabilis (strain 225) TaxID=743718 RepID=F6FUT5_ISOV2|nr:hypothetical protein [Isoptericola variabilis]AEG43346.1 hypothetical protein Isova_0553 [Isoptericola variabilis 225]TWH34605.1 hypothetical protein L600_001100000870 [Isoptericola variabilis J7]
MTLAEAPSRAPSRTAVRLAHLVVALCALTNAALVAVVFLVLAGLVRWVDRRLPATA